MRHSARPAEGGQYVETCACLGLDLCVSSGAERSAANIPSGGVVDYAATCGPLSGDGFELRCTGQPQILLAMSPAVPLVLCIYLQQVQVMFVMTSLVDAAQSTAVFCRAELRGLVWLWDYGDQVWD